MEKKFISDDLKLSFMVREGKKKFRWETAVVSKATAVPNFRTVTLPLVEIMLVLLLVSKSGTSAPPPPLILGVRGQLLKQNMHLFGCYYCRKY